MDKLFLTNERWRAARSLFQTILPRLVMDPSPSPGRLPATVRFFTRVCITAAVSALVTGATSRATFMIVGHSFGRSRPDDNFRFGLKNLPARGASMRYTVLMRTHV